jgi:choice-of-anchor B domain-containing protein
MRIKYLIILLLSFTSVYSQTDLNISLLGKFEYTNTDLNDIWGYADNGKEYALVGTYDGLSIVDVTNPEKPVEVNYIKTINSVWKDIKTYSHYAYVTHGIYSSGQNAQGLMIIDLNTIGNDEMDTWTYKIDNVYQTAHNLFIDENGIAYIFGVNEIGGALILDLKDNPTSPEFLSYYQGHYLHDGYVKNNTLYGCADKNGYFVIVDVTDKFNPKDVVTSETPNRTTHNAWLSSDAKTLFTTDERKSAYITSFDVSDTDNIKQLDMVRSRYSDQSIPHNTVVRGDFLISSYYAQGVQIVDASNPDNLIEVGRYDTTPNDKAEFNGAWGVYPYLPSGNILVSDTEHGLFVLKPDYHKASYLEGIVKDESTNGTIYNAEIEIETSGNPTFTGYMGKFKTGIANSGTYTVTVKKEGYETLTTEVVLEQGKIQNKEFVLTQDALSIDDELLSEINVYPNPFKDFLQVDYSFKDALQNTAHLVLTNTKGQEIYRLDINNTQGSLLLDKEIEAGVYFVQIFNGTKMSRVVRVVKE